MRIRVKPHIRRLYKKKVKVRGHNRRILKNYGAFKFIAPFEQFKQTGIVEPEFARFGTKKLKLSSEKKRREAEAKTPENIEEELQEIREAQRVKKPIILTKKPERPEGKLTPDQKFIVEVAEKGEDLDEVKIAQMQKSRIGQITESQFDRYSDLSNEDKKRAEKVLLNLETKDPKGRSIALNRLIRQAADIVREEKKTGKQTAIKDVKSFEDADFLEALQVAGFPKQQAEFLFFTGIPQDELKGKTPAQVVALAEKLEGAHATGELGEGMEFSSAGKFESISQEKIFTLLDKLLDRRPDLKKFNRITLANKLRKDLRESASEFEKKGISGDSEVLGELTSLFSHDKPLKESIEEEKT